MLKRLVMFGVLLSTATAAQAETYVILPNPGAISPTPLIVQGNATHSSQVFVCSSLNDLAAGTCRLHRKSVRP